MITPVYTWLVDLVFPAFSAPEPVWNLGYDNFDRVNWNLKVRNLLFRGTVNAGLNRPIKCKRRPGRSLRGVPWRANRSIHSSLSASGYPLGFPI